MDYQSLIAETLKITPTRAALAALYVDPTGSYAGLDGVELWDEDRDARTYPGPHPIVAHPPCQRWGRFWHGSPSRPHQYKLGDDGGCFAAALASLRRWGGVLEHPADSHAWDYHCIPRPPRAGGWIYAGRGYGSPTMWTCCVYQGHYGHAAGKPTWLLAAGMPLSALPSLRWGKTEQRLHPGVLARHGYARARRMGMTSAIGGKDKTKIRNATPPEFRDLLLSIARLCDVQV